MKRAAAACAILALTVGACGGGGGGDSNTRLDVAAAASLTKAVTAYATQFGNANHATVRVRFGGSDELAAQIRQGVPTDVFLSADQKQPRTLHHGGAVQSPVTFTSNRLVVAAAKGGRVKTLSDLGSSGVKLAIGDRSVPIGEYAHYAIARLPGVNPAVVLKNIRSEEPDVKSVVAKVAQGAADAGIVYVTDANAAKGELMTIAIPQSAQPRILYDAAVGSKSKQANLARRFIDGLRSGPGRTDLLNAGFLGAAR
ncbi:MAG: molybdate ABC transporter substrate-binding protein [Thermoleophilaceae bacterium]